MAEHCFHCGEPVPAGCDCRDTFDGEAVAFCCPACLSVFRLIHGSGLDSYYRNREQAAPTPGDNARYDAFDLAEVRAGFTDCTDEVCESRLIVEGIHCSSCTWLIEQHLSRLPGVRSVNVQLHNQLARIEWVPAETRLSSVFRAIAELGYRPLPYRPSERDELVRRTRRAYLGRLGVAGIAAMQVGMFAIALYAGESQAMEDHWRDMLRYFSLLLATAVVFYAAQPFFTGAWNSLRSGVAGMDVPVALAIGLAYSFSVVATFSGSGQVYFDSVCMFTFFLLGSRYLEFQARSQQWFFPRDLLPDSAFRCRGNTVEQVALSQLRAGDIIQVAPGDTVPADGVVRRGEGSVNEAAFTGEFLPVHKQVGEQVLAGSVNGDCPLDIEVTALRGEAVLHGIEKLADRAMADKPAMTQFADRLSHYFVLAVLSVCAVTALYWLRVDPSQALWVSLAVLVVSCPCALSLATPSALATALRQLQRRGVLVTRSAVLETLPACKTVVFDKTGTLTRGEASVDEIRIEEGFDRERCLVIAAALEARSSHPLAAAFRDISPMVAVDKQRHVTGAGVEGHIDGRVYRLGSAEFCGELIDRTLALPDDRGRWLALCSERDLLAWFAIGDPLRADAATTVAALTAGGLQVHLLSGDNSGHVADTAEALGITHWRAGASAGEKLRYLRELQGRGPVLVVGDGINDLPVLAAADVSVAVSEASDLSKTRADCILLSPRLSVLTELMSVAGRTCRVVRQNIGWALVYNGLAVPLAATGMVPPWAAAIGMSLSSLLVVANSQRLARYMQQSELDPAPDWVSHVGGAG